MRVSPGDLRQGLTDPKYAIPRSKSPIVSPHSILTKAVKVLHQEGVAEADAYITTALNTPGWKTSRTRTKAQNALASFHNYKGMAAEDTRPVAIGDSHSSVIIAGHNVAAACNVVVLDDAGVEGRVCIWSVVERPFTDAEMALLTCPIVLALGDELGADRVLGVDFWFLRANAQTFVDSEKALAALPELNTIVRRLTVNAGAGS